MGRGSRAHRVVGEVGSFDVRVIVRNPGERQNGGRPDAPAGRSRFGREACADDFAALHDVHIVPGQHLLPGPGDANFERTKIRFIGRTFHEPGQFLRLRLMWGDVILGHFRAKPAASGRCQPTGAHVGTISPDLSYCHRDSTHRHRHKYTCTDT